MTIEVGKQVPDFTLENQAAEKITLSDFKGKNVVVYFYPRDMTPGCTTQACDFRDNYAAFTDLNTVVLGISPDPIKSHEKFMNKHDLPFNLLADTENVAAKLYDVWKLKKMFGKEFLGIERSTFIIDAKGVLQKEYRKVKVPNHIAETLDFVKENLI